MSNTYNVTQPNVSLSDDNSTFDVQSGASLNLTGSSDYVIVENGAGGGSVTGDNNTISGSATIGAGASVSGNGNNVTLGDGGSVGESGSGNTITIGANGSYVGHGVNSVVYATKGGDYLEMWGNGETAYANNDVIQVATDTATVSGNNNRILTAMSRVLNLGGSNNTVELSNGIQILTSGGSVTENSDGTVVLTGNVAPGGVTLTGGVMSVQMGNGNVATLSGVSSGTQFEYVDSNGNGTWTTLTDTGANQLVSAMASYSTGGGVAATSQLTMQPAANAALFASSHHA